MATKRKPRPVGRRWRAWATMTPIRFDFGPKIPATWSTKKMADNVGRYHGIVPFQIEIREIRPARARKARHAR